MCIATPMQIIELNGPGWALCADGVDEGRREPADMRLVGDQPPGSWLLVFLGAARDVIDETRAHQTRDALLALHAVAAGAPFEHLFADLIGREPQLPEFLRESGQPSANSDQRSVVRDETAAWSVSCQARQAEPTSLPADR